MVKSDILILNESEIQYTITGEGPGLIFVHGLGGNHLSWWQQLPFFSKRFTCVTYSQRGFGSSKNISGRIESSVFADDLAALIDHLALKQVVLVAQSMGGWTCVHYALREKNRVRALVLASTTGPLNFTLIDHPEIRNLPRWNEWESKNSKILKQRGILKSAGGRMAEESPALYYLYHQIYVQTPGEYREALRKKIREERVVTPAIFSAVDVPTLFITGDEDLLFPPGAAVAAASIMPSARSCVVPSTGHSVYFERAARFNALLDDFFTSCSL